METGGIVPLTDAQCRKAPPKEKDYKLPDAGGLYLFVTTKGFKSWRFKYRFGDRPDGKPGKQERRLIFGPYPEISLVDARDRRDDAKRLLRDHKDPGAEERKRKVAAHSAAAVTLEPTAMRWHTAQLGRWSATHATKVREALERDVYPDIGAIPLSEINTPMVIALLRKVEKRGAIDTAKRIRQYISAVFEFAIAEGLIGADPAGNAVKKALLPTPIGGSQPGVNTPAAARKLQAAMDASTAGPLTKLASRLLSLTVVRPGLVPTARWPEFEGIDWEDGDAPAPEAVWRISAQRMKLVLEDKGDEVFEHLVPLPPEAVRVLHAVRRLTGRFPYLFHSNRSTHKPMSNNTIGFMYATNGYKGIHVPHGWRSSFSTIMNERAVRQGRDADRAIIDAMLSHKPRGISGSEMAYNRALFWERRREIADEWADLITEGLIEPNRLLQGYLRAG